MYNVFNIEINPYYLYLKIITKFKFKLENINKYVKYKTIICYVITNFVKYLGTNI